MSIPPDQLTEFVVGQKASIICRLPQITVPMTAEWRRETNEIIFRRKYYPFGEADTGFSSPEKFYLKIEAVSLQDSGRYTCQANSSIGSDKDSFFLNVTSKWCGHSILTISW